MYPTGNRRNRALFTWQKQKCRLPSKLSLLRGSRPKSAREAPTMCSQCFRFHTNPFTFGRVIAERVNIVFCHVKCSHDSPEAKHRFNWANKFYWAGWATCFVASRFCVCTVRLCSRERSTVPPRRKRLRRISTSGGHLPAYDVWTETATFLVWPSVGLDLFRRLRSLRETRLLESGRTASLGAQALWSRK